MRIMLVNTFYYPEIKGGAEYSVKKLAEGLTLRGHAVCVLVAGSVNEDVEIDGVSVARRKFNSIYHSYGNVNKTLIKKITHRMLDFYNIRNKSIIKKIIEEFKPDIIHTNNLYEITPIIWDIARKNNIRIIHTIRDYYLLCYKTNLLNSKLQTCDKGKFPCKIYQNINKVFTKNVNVLTAPTYAMLNRITSMGFFEKSYKKVIYNAIDFISDEVNKKINYKLEHSSSVVTFVYLGGFHKHKGIEYLIDTFKTLPHANIKLIFAGKGTLLNFVLDSCNNDSRISYAGFLSEQEINILLKECDVLICPSLWEEPFGRVILDAYANGLPAIVTNIGGLPELVEQGKTGWIVERGNSKQLADTIQLIAEDPSILNSYRRNLYAQLQKFSLQKQITEFEKIYMHNYN